ncbi:MAG TPA: extracellular solute-binding protein [Streptosporangiaceae bacterium]|jgi:ABC-type glycerol-3-phosphate transport system substrate-binding protein
MTDYPSLSGPSLAREAVSRRTALRALGIGAGAAALGPALAACGSSGSGGSASGGGRGSTITYSVQSFAQPALKPFLAEFKQQTGITVKLQNGPATGAALLTQVIPAFNSGTSPYDVMDTDDPSTGALVGAGWLSPLDSALNQTFWNDLTPGMTSASKTWNSKDGKTYRVYHNWDMGYYWLRGDLLTAHHLTAPTTWDELVSTGTELKAKTGMYAFADAASKPGLTFVYLAYLAAQAGGQLYQFDDGTAQAFQFAHDLIYKHQIFPKDAITWTYDQLNSSYLTNKVMSMREWTFFWDTATADKSWYKPAKIDITAPPAGPGGHKTWAGGWGMAVPKASKNQEAALKFVKYMSSPDVAVRLAQANSFFVTARKSVLAKLGSTGIVADMKTYSDSGYVTPRPFHPQAARAESTIDDIGQAYLTNQLSLSQAMSQGKQRIAALGS